MFDIHLKHSNTAFIIKRKKITENNFKECFFNKQ